MELNLQATLLPQSKKLSSPPFTLYYHFLMLGAGLMISWSTLSTAFDWIMFKFPSEDASTELTFAMVVPNVVAQPLIILYGRHFSFSTKTMTSFIAMGVLLLMTPFIVEFFPQGYKLLLVTTVGMGAFNALSQITVYGLAGTMPGRYTGAVMVGNSLGGITMSVARMVCLWLLGSDEVSLLISTVVYFTLGGLMMVLCIISPVMLMKDSFVIKCVKKSQKRSGESGVIKERPSTFTVLKEVWGYVILAFTNFFITFSVFPTVALATSSEDINYSWLSVLLLFVFNICDFAGRYFAGDYHISGVLYWVFVYSRFLFWESLILITTASSHAWLFGSDWFKIVNIALFAFSHGYGGTCAMILAPASVKPTLKNKTGSIMSIALVWGVVAGSIAGFHFTPIVRAQRSQSFGFV